MTTHLADEAETDTMSLLLAGIANNADDAIIGMTLEGIITGWNPGAARMFGYSAEEAAGQSSRMLIPLECLDKERSLLERLARGECMDHFETTHVRKDGKRLEVLLIFSPIRDAAHKIIGVSKIVRDITAHRLAEAELRWKTAFFETQVNSALDAILVVNDQAKRILQNQVLLRLFQIPDDMANSDDNVQWLQHVSRQVKDPEQFRQRVAYLYEHPDEIGRDEIELTGGKILDCYSAPVRDQTGKYYGRIWTFRDITNQRKLEEQLRQSQKMEAIGRLVGGIAHDFNNILTVIRMNCDLMRMNDSLLPVNEQCADEIQAAAERATALIRQLLIFSRKEVLRPHELDLNHSVNSLSKMLQRVLGEDILVRLKFAMEPLYVRADPGMLDQVLMNLAVNARDAMPDGGQLLIETMAVEFDEQDTAQSDKIRPGKFVCLAVSDTGCGIPSENLPHVFEPFFTTKEAGKGTGFGLSTVFGIVQQHRGWINVYSEVGDGTIFFIYLPRQMNISTRPSAEIATPAMCEAQEPGC